MKRQHLLLHTLLAVVVCVSAMACSNDTPSDPGTGGVSDTLAVGARMYVNGVDSSDTLRIFARTDNRVSFIFYNSGAQPLDIESSSTLQVIFTPSSLATALDFPGINFSKTVTTQQNPGTKGQITLKLQHNGNTRTLGAYNVLII